MVKQMHPAMSSPTMALSRVFFRWMASITRVMEGRLPGGGFRLIAFYCTLRKFKSIKYGNQVKNARTRQPSERAVGALQRVPLCPQPVLGLHRLAVACARIVDAKKSASQPTPNPSTALDPQQRTNARPHNTSQPTNQKHKTDLRMLPTERREEWMAFRSRSSWSICGLPQSPVPDFFRLCVCRG